jgi:putative colanic acid biosysnthesis UDP-glucose lipid carrier transferase
MQHLRYSHYIKPLIILGDLLFLSLGFAYFMDKISVSADGKEFYKIAFSSLALLLMAWVLFARQTGLYQIGRSFTFGKLLGRLGQQLLYFFVAYAFVCKVTHVAVLSKNFLWSYFWLSVGVFLLHILAYFALKYWRSLGKNHRNIMIFGQGELQNLLRHTLQQRKDYGYKEFEHHFDLKDLVLEDLANFMKLFGIYGLFITCSDYEQMPENHQLKDFLEAHQIELILIPEINHYQASFQHEYLSFIPVMLRQKYPLERSQNFFIKRIFDVIFAAGFILFIGIWLLPLIALLIWLVDGNRPIFIQKRYGIRKDIFDCYKFKTMADTPLNNQQVTQAHDQRITKLGHFLRKTSLDETPQFINVLLGNMSIIGPRPHMLVVDDEYQHKLERYILRCHSKPGITGLAQVNGFRGDAGDRDVQMKKRLLSDIFYIKNWSIGLDLIIIFKTIVLLLRGDANAR